MSRDLAVTRGQLSLRIVLLIALIACALGALQAHGEGPAPRPSMVASQVPAADAAAEAAARTRAAELRKAVQQHPSDAETLLLTAMRDPHPRVRETAVGLLSGEVSGPAAEMLLALCADESWSVRHAASGKLSEIFGEDHRPLLPRCFALLASPWPEVRADAVMALAGAKDDRIVPKVAAMVDDPDAHVRAHAMAALGKQGGERAAALVEQRVARPGAHNWVIWYGTDALEAMGAVDALQRLANSPGRRVRTSALAKLLTLAPSKAIPGALAVVRDDTFMPRTRAEFTSLLREAGYTGPLPQIPVFVGYDVSTPEPEAVPTEPYQRPRPWTPRLCAVDLGGGRVYLGWSVTSDEKEQYRLTRAGTDGSWTTLTVTRAGSYIDEQAPVGMPARYRVLNREGLASTIAQVVPAAEAPDRAGLAWTTANDVHPIWRELEAIGDLDGDGRIDYVVSNAEKSAKRAFSATGKLLWQRPYSAGDVYGPSIRALIGDLEGDGRSEVVAFEEQGDRKWLVLCDGATGRVERHVDMTRYTNNIWERRDRVLLVDRTGGGHEDTIVLVHNTYGCTQAVAFDAELNHLWTHSGARTTAHKPAVVDLDGDGRDEVILGGDCIATSSGELRWQMPSITGDGHQDGIRPMDIDPERPGVEVAVAGCDTNLTWMVDWRGRLLWLRDTGHSQWVMPGRFAPGGGIEVWMGPAHDYHHNPSLRLTTDGAVIAEAPFRTTAAKLDWDGDPATGDELLLWSGAVHQPKTGETLYRVPRTGGLWVADICGDSREEIIVTDARAGRIEVYTNATVNPNPRPDRWDVGYWRYRSADQKAYGRVYANPEF